MEVCAYRECETTFEPKVSWQIYCCTECRLKENTAIEETVRKPKRKEEGKLCHCGCGKPRGKGKTLLSEYCFRNGESGMEDWHSVHVN